MPVGILVSSMRQAGVTLPELLTVVAILGALALIAIPRLPMGAIWKSQADVLSAKLATDLRRTRSMAIRDAATNSSGYRMVVAASQYRLENLATSAFLRPISYRIPWRFPREPLILDRWEIYSVAAIKNSP